MLHEYQDLKTGTKKLYIVLFGDKGDLQRIIFSILFCCYAGDALEISVKGRRFGEAKHKGRFLKCLCDACIDEALSMIYNFTNIGDENSLALHNPKWRLRAFFGLRL